jgi:hypothetical protein
MPASWMKLRINWVARMLCAIGLALCAGCEATDTIQSESQIVAPVESPSRIAIAPALNLSGAKTPDPLLQADIVFQTMQEVRGFVVLPVNRTVEAMAGLRIRQIDSPEQAYVLCEALGVDAIVVPTITMYDPYTPPKMGASLAVFARRGGWVRKSDLDVRGLTRRATEDTLQLPARNADFIQTAGVFDADNGSVRQRLQNYARGRNAPTSPMGDREFTHNMDRFAGFVWYELIRDAVAQMK